MIPLALGGQPWQEGHRRRQGGPRRGRVRRLNGAELRATAGAYRDVATKFFHGEIKSSAEAVPALVHAINNAKQPRAAGA